MKNKGKKIQRLEVGKSAKKNPFGFLLIGLGAGLLVFDLFGKKKKKYHSPYRYYGANDHPLDVEKRNSVAKKLRSAGAKIGDTAHLAYETVSTATENAIQKVGNAASSAYEGVTTTTENTYESISEFAGNAYEKAGQYRTQAHEQYEHQIEENPLAVGAVALAIGAAVGLAIPATHYENELLGEYREQLIDKAKAVAAGYVDQAKQSVVNARQTINNEVISTVAESRRAYSSNKNDADLVG